MKRVLFAFLFAVPAVFAEETGGEEAASADDAAVVQPKKEVPRAMFMTLPLCRRVEGDVSVRQPGAPEWSPAEEGRFYPLGTSFRTAGKGRLTVSFAKDAFADIGGDAEFGTRRQPLGVQSRTIVLVRGTLELKLADNLPEGAFFLAAPGFTVKNPAGESSYVYEDMGDGDRVTVSCRTGSLAVEGRHFAIPDMRAAHTVVIRTSHDLLSTFLYGKSGDPAVKLDKNVRFREEVGDDGKMRRIEERDFAEFRLSPATKVVINRSVPAIGERMSAFIMAFDASGERLGEGITVCEGRAEINGGELVAKKTVSGEELVKQATEAEKGPASEGGDGASESADAAPSGEATSENKEEE